MKRTCLLGLLLSLNPTAYAIDFGFVFDNDPNPGLQPPLVGSGSFTFATDPGDGTFPFSSLGTFSMSFVFPEVGALFTEADIISNLDDAAVVLSTGPLGRRLQFSDGGSGSSGPFGGALDLLNPLDFALSFEPSYVGEGLRLYFTDTFQTFLFGDYVAQGASVPDESSTAGLLALGALLLVGIASVHKVFRTQSLGS